MNDISTRAGFCAIIGAPNAGKSTLVNYLVGSKISIVSHKVQTTRARLRAIFNAASTQVILVDTPGIFKPRRKLDEAMVTNAWTGSIEADATILLIDARAGLNEEVRAIIAELEQPQGQGLAGSEQGRPGGSRKTSAAVGGDQQACAV